MLWLAGEAAAAAEPTTMPATAPAKASSVEQHAIRGGAGGGPVKAGGSSAAEAAWSTGRVVGAMGVVIAAIFGMRYAGRRIFGLQAATGSSSSVRVLSRTVISPRQQVVLVQIGRRVIVVANSGNQMNTLCQITDPDEVASLAGKAAGGGDSKFTAAFGKAAEEFDDEETAGKSAEVTGSLPEAVAVAAAQTADDADVGRTRQELGGLREKVRTLSKAFRYGR